LTGGYFACRRRAPPSAAREKMHMSHTTIPRRTVLLGATAIGLGAAAGFRIPTGEARAPIVSGQVPYFSAKAPFPLRAIV
jgi:hypothetical protein